VPQGVIVVKFTTLHALSFQKLLLLFVVPFISGEVNVMYLVTLGFLVTEFGEYSHPFKPCIVCYFPECISYFCRGTLISYISFSGLTLVFGRHMKGVLLLFPLVLL